MKIKSVYVFICTLNRYKIIKKILNERPVTKSMCNLNAVKERKFL